MPAVLPAVWSRLRCQLCGHVSRATCVASCVYLCTSPPSPPLTLPSASTQIPLLTRGPWEWDDEVNAALRSAARLHGAAAAAVDAAVVSAHVAVM